MVRGRIWPGPCDVAGPHDAELAARGSDEIVASTVEHRGRFAVGGLLGAGGPGGADRELMGQFVAGSLRGLVAPPRAGGATGHRPALR